MKPIPARYRIEELIPARHAIGGAAYWHPHEPTFADEEQAIGAFREYAKRTLNPVRLVRMDFTIVEVSE